MAYHDCDPAQFDVHGSDCDDPRYAVIETKPTPTGFHYHRLAVCASRADADRVRDALEAAWEREARGRLLDECVPITWPSHGPEARTICHVAHLDDGQKIVQALNLAEDLEVAAKQAIAECPMVSAIVLRAVGR